MILRLPILFVLFALMVLAPGLPQSVSGDGAWGLAWADDDDDGDDDDDDGGGRDDDDDDGSARQTTSRMAPPPAPAPPPPAFATGEILSSRLSEDELSALTAQGFSVLSEGGAWHRLAIPEGSAIEDARTIVRDLPSAPTADFNHFYRTDQGFAEDCRGIDCPAREIIDWPEISGIETCGDGVRIGMIDTGINIDHETFADASLSVRQLTPGRIDPSQAIHGTAVASLFVGDPASRSPGLIPAAHLVAVDSFYRAGSDERTDAAALIEALAQLADEDVSVINLSLSGPENLLLSETIDELIDQRDIVVVSAVGNAGPSAEIAFPAGFEPVVAVTAVDRNMAVYRRAVRGDHVDLAAPGVDVWSAASISGARTHTGTSFAAPFVSAAAALLRQGQPELSAGEVADTLRDRAQDLGEPGPDAVFGAGLIDGGALCPAG